MPRGRFTALLLPLLVYPACAESPVLRYTSYLLVDTADGPAQVRLQSRPYGAVHGDYTYGDQPSYRVIAADGAQLEDIDGALGGSIDLVVPAAAGAFGLVELRPGNNYVVADPQAPYGIVATEHAPMNCVGGFDRLHFFVPRGHTGGSIYLHAFSVGEAARAVICGPDGAVLTEVEDDFNEPTAVNFTVPAGADDAVWSLRLLPPQRPDWKIDDCKLWFSSSLPGLLCPDPQWARRLSAPFCWTWRPLLDFEADDPVATVQWSYPIAEGQPQPTYRLGLSDDNPHTGRSSLRIEMSLPAGTNRQELKIFTKPVPLDQLQRLRLWLYGDGSGRKLIVRVRDASQEQHYFTAAPITWTGWAEVVCDFQAGPVTIAGGDENKRIDGPTVTIVLQIGHEVGQPSHSVLYLDDLGVSP